MIHKLSEVLDLQGGAASSAGIAAASYSSVQCSAGVDLTKYKGAIGWQINAGTFGSSATLDAKIQESDDNSTFTDLSPAVAMTQKTAAGQAVLETRVRTFTKRYGRIALTPAVAAVVAGATFIGQKRSL